MTRVTQVTRQKINELNLDEVLFPYIGHSYIGGIDLGPFLSRLTFRVSLVSLAGQTVAGHFYPGGRDATTVREIPWVAAK
jgi:hypothetical protein